MHPILQASASTNNSTVSDFDKLIEQSQGTAFEALGTMITFVAAFALLYYALKRVFKPALQRLLHSRDVDPTVVSLSMSIVEAVALLISIAAASTIAGFEVVMSAFATLTGAVALAVGFAAQDMVSNFVSGVFILRDEPFHVGDWIEWNDNEGVVREVQLRTSKIETFDNEVITVPNSHLANNAVTNPVSNDTLRITFLFGIDYDDDIEHAKQVILEEARSTPGTVSDPSPVVRLTELGDSYVGLTGAVWIADPTHSDYVKVRSDFVQAVKERFDAEGIDMPYPFTELTGEVSVSDPVMPPQRDATVND
ncbi:mechanosensitive ion channel family protein [Halocatena salina]|uniref:Mechanosensitive ion channel n=1 Tax=Halocatena salina TaxID=2934340 RepID=A0A8U0A3D1_9EURY|nr:mechanosensitive ion channel family protein [Halocatena salina]UPM43299.1 mechanosensitive ion channel [Halocatena salina]